jgi:uncharacterized protein Yka (UPF0111/DUF47 family)
MLDRAVKWLLPRETHFFDLLERGAACAVQSGVVLVELCRAPQTSREDIIRRLREIEHDADSVIHDVYDALNRTFVTPIDRTDIYTLATDIEEIVDLNHATANQITVHVLEDLPEGSIDLALLIHRAALEIEMGVKLLRSLKQLEKVKTHCAALNQLEHDGDDIYRARIGALFRSEKNAVRLIQHKEFLEGLERTLDACDQVATALETIVIKNA